MSVLTESPPKWRPRQRIRPRPSRASSIFDDEGDPSTQASNYYPVIGGNAPTHGPSHADSGLVGLSTTRSLKLFFEPAPAKEEASTSTPAHHPTASVPPPKPQIGVSKAARQKSDNPPPSRSTEEAEPPPAQPPIIPSLHQSAPSVLQQQNPATLVKPAAERALFSRPQPTPETPIRQEYLLAMSKKPKRLPKTGYNNAGGGRDIMDSLVSSFNDLDSAQMRGLCHANGDHGRKQSDPIGSVTSISPAPVIPISKSSTRSPSGSGQKLQRRNSGKRGSGSSSRDSNGTRNNLRSSSSQEHWLPPIEQEDDVFSVPTANTSYSSSPSNGSARHPSIPTRTSSAAHELHAPQFAPRSNSLMTAVTPPISVRPSNSRRSENYSDVPPYITRYLRERTDSKENLGVLSSPASPVSPRRQTLGPKTISGRTRNSTTMILPGNDSYTKLNKLVTKRQSSQGFDRDLSATRYYYSIPTQSGPRRSTSLDPSRSSLASDGSIPYSHGNYVHEVLNNPKLTQRIRLSSGRILSFSEVGDETGWPVFCFTGMGLNRLVAAFYDEIATSFGLRIITPDRPGIGLSDEIRPSPKKVLAWADDILEICQALSIQHFSLLGHSLGATYALAVSLRVPERVRGRVHLLAPWIPLSQVNAATAMFDDIAMDSSCMSFPATHRFLRVLPVPIIKVAGSFLKEKEYDGRSNGMTSPREVRRSATLPGSSRTRSMNSTITSDFAAKEGSETSSASGKENDLVAAIWAAATRDSNAVVDLLTSLERPHTVGFTYFDVTLPVMIRHGSKDDRVPLERVAWMTKAMNMARPDNAELKVIQGAQHGLMARADVMSDVFEEVARESHKWDGCNRCRKGGGCWLATNVKEAPPVPGKERMKR